MFISHVRPWSRGNSTAVRDFFVSYSKSSHSFYTVIPLLLHQPCQRREEIFCFLSIKFHVPYYQLLCHSCLHFETIFKFVAAKTLLRVQKEIITGLERDNYRSAVNSPCIITVSEDCLFEKYYTMWTRFSTDSCN